MKPKAMHLCQVARLEDPEISAEKREGRSLQKPESLKSAVNGEPREGSLQESAVYGFKKKSRQSRQSASTGTPGVDDKKLIVMILTAGLYNKSHTSLSHVASMALHIKQIALGYHYRRLWSSKDDSSSDDDSETHVKALCTEIPQLRAHSKTRHRNQALALAARVAILDGAAMLQASTPAMTVRTPTTTAVIANKAYNI